MTACKCLSNKKEPWSPQAPDNSMTCSWALLPKSLGRVYVQSTWGIDLHFSQLRVPTDPAGCQPWPAAATHVKKCTVWPKGPSPELSYLTPFTSQRRAMDLSPLLLRRRALPSSPASLLPPSSFLTRASTSLPLPGSPTPLLTWGLKILLHLYILPLPPNSSSKPSPSS